MPERASVSGNDLGMPRTIVYPPAQLKSVPVVSIAVTPPSHVIRYDTRPDAAPADLDVHESWLEP